MRRIVSEWVIDAHGCQGPIQDLEPMLQKSREALESVGSTVVAIAHYQFQPHGMTLSLILRESHFVLSTWPEHQLVIANIFLCNSRMNAKRVWKKLESFLLPDHCIFHEVVHELPSKRLKSAA